MVLHKWFLERLHYTEKIQLVGAENSVYSVGRGKENFLKCPSIFVSRRHCVITLKDDNSLTIKDLDSSNGTYVNQSKILKNRDIPLEPGDEIGLGVMEVQTSECYVFKLLQEEILTSPAPSIRLSDDDDDCQVIVLSDSDDANSIKKEPLDNSKSSSDPAASVVGFPVVSEEKQLGCDIRKPGPLANISSPHKFLIPSTPAVPSVSCIDPKSNTLVTNTCKAVKVVSGEADCDETFIHNPKSEEHLQGKSDKQQESSNLAENFAIHHKTSTDKGNIHTSTPNVTERVIPFLKSGPTDVPSKLGGLVSDLFSCKNVNSSHLGVEEKPFKVKEAPNESKCVNNVCKIKTEPVVDSEISQVTVNSNYVGVEEKKMKGSLSKSECVNTCKIKVEPKCESEISDITVGTAGTASEDSKNILRMNNKLDDTLREITQIPVVPEDRNSVVYDNSVNNLESNNTIFPQDFYSRLEEREKNKELPTTVKCEKSLNSEDLLRKISSPSSQPIVKLVRLDSQQLEKMSSDVRSSSDSVSDYTLEDDVVIISDDDDDDVIALPVSDANVKEEPIEAEDNAEEAGSDSDNEWWPKLSQSFLESIEQEEAEMQNEETSSGPPDDELDSHDIFTSSGKRKSSVLSEDECEIEESAADGLVNYEIFSTPRKRKNLKFSENEDEISTDISAAQITDCQDPRILLSSCMVTKDLEKVDHTIEHTTDVPKHIENIQRISLPPANNTSKERDHHGFIKRNNGSHAQNLDIDSLVKKKMETSAYKSRKPVLIDAPPMHPKHSRRKETEKYAPKRKTSEDDNKKKNEDDKRERSTDSSASIVVSKKKRKRTSSSPRTSKSNPLPTSDKKKIHDMRKEKLKALASQSKPVSAEQTVNRTKAKVPIKNTKLSRGDILVEDLVPSYKVSREGIPSSSSSSSSSHKPSVHTTLKENDKLKVSAPLPDQKTKPLSKEVTESHKSTTGPKQSIRDLPRIPKKNKESVKPTVDNSGQINSESLNDPLLNLHLGCEEQLGKEMSVLENSKTQLRPSLLLTSSVHTQLGSSGSKGKLKKRVSFKSDNDLCEIQFIPVENFSALRPVAASVKDAPVHRSNCNFQSRDLSMINILDETLFTVCNWNVKWLQEQKGSSKPPPCYGNVQLCPMLTSFSSYADYYRIANPLMLLTLWAKICDESIKAECRSLPNVVTLEKVEEKITGDNKYMLIRCHVLLTTSADRNQVHPYTGDLCQLDIYLDPTTAPQDDHNLIVAESQGSTVHCVRLFTYIESIHKEPYSTNSNPAWAHVKAEQRPTCKLNIIMKMKYKDCIHQNYKLKLRVLCNIRNELRVFEAVAMLPRSRLCNQILNPMKHDYLLPSVDPRKQPLVLKELSLNESQKKAVLQSAAMCLKSSPKIALIQGPPGTGKSTVIVNIIAQILYGDQNYGYLKNYRRGNRPRILLCAPSNAAVDELVTRLLSIRQTLPKEERFRMVRVGRLASMRHNVREISLQELTKRDMKQTRFEGETMESVEIEIRNQEAKCRSYEISLESARRKNTDMSLYLKKIADIMKKISQLKNMSLNKAEQQVDKRLERQTQIKILSGADIVATTLGSCSLTLVSEVFGRGGDGQTKFTCCILDEATQCCEPEGLLPLMLGIEKLILVGDPEQLPATVVSKEAQNYGYGQSLFTRIWNKFLNDPGSPIQFLNIQHRMDPEICLWPSQYFYNNSLITSQCRPAKHVPLKPYVVLSEEFTQTAYNEIVNQNEAKLVCLIAIGIYELVDKNTSISIITPYSKQRSEILKYMTEDRTVPSNWSITVNTIDSFQGQECDVVIMSCARTEGVGFLTDTQRLCVALTRARCSLIICGNFVSLSRDLMWHELLENASQRGLLFKLNCSRLPRKEDALKYIIR